MTYNLFQAFVQGFSDGMELIVLQAKQFVVIFTVPEAHKQVGGFYIMVQQISMFGIGMHFGDLLHFYHWHWLS